MYAREYAKLRGLPYGLILRLCREGKIPSLKQQKYVLDPDEADAAIAALKVAPKYTEKQRQAVERKQERKVEKTIVKPKFNFLESLENLRKAR